MSLGLRTLWQIMFLLSQSAIVTLTFWHGAEVVCMGESSFGLWNLEFHFFLEKYLELERIVYFWVGQTPILGQDGLGLGGAPTMQGAAPAEEVQASTGANPAARPAQPSVCWSHTPSCWGFKAGPSAPDALQVHSLQTAITLFLLRTPQTRTEFFPV